MWGTSKNSSSGKTRGKECQLSGKTSPIEKNLSKKEANSPTFFVFSKNGDFLEVSDVIKYARMATVTR